MTGVVLCGGRSTRMGTDKGMIRQSGKTWVQIAHSKLSSLNLPVFVSTNSLQLELYSGYFTINNLVIDDQTLSIGGPLLGLLSVHQKIPDEDLLVLACDMIEMRIEPLKNLLKIYNEDRHEAYVYSANEKLQPLCAVYTSKGLKQILELYQQQRLKNFSMVHTLECIDTKYIPAESVHMSCFVNLNSAKDLLSQ